MKKVICVVKNEYGRIYEFVILMEDESTQFCYITKYEILLFRLKNKFARIYIIYMLKKIFS